MFALITVTGQVCEITASSFEVNPEMQWIDLTNVSPPPEVGWSYSGGQFAAPAQPAPSYSEVLAGKISAGIAITCTGTPSLSATYAMDSVTMDQIGSVARDAASGLGLPGSGTSFMYPDITSNMHTFTEAQVIALYKAMRDLLLQLNTQAAVLHAGGTPSWPSQAATIP